MFQAEGVITIGGTDYSDEVIEFRIDRTRELVKGPATFGNIRAKQAAGALDEVVVITALNEITAASLAPIQHAAGHRGGNDQRCPSELSWRALPHREAVRGLPHADPDRGVRPQVYAHVL